MDAIWDRHAGQAGGYLDGDAFGVEGLGGLVGPVGLFVVDPGQDHGVFVELLEAARGEHG